MVIIRNRVLLLPVLGVCLFVVLYIIAAALYPGGSQADIHSTGFSWKDNYWCNLFNKTSINGEENPARPVALIAMIILAISLQFFWMQIGLLAMKNKWLGRITLISSLCCSGLIISLGTSHSHDLLVNLASLAGLIATICTLVVLYQMKWNSLFTFGLVNILLVVLNNYVYYSNGLIEWLPVIQKITFLFFLLWICCTNWYISQKEPGSILSRVA